MSHRGPGKIDDNAFNDCYTNASLFVDPMYLCMNMSKHLGAELNLALGLYDASLHALFFLTSDKLIAQFGPHQLDYVGKYKIDNFFAPIQTYMILSQHHRALRLLRQLRSAITLGQWSRGKWRR